MKRFTAALLALVLTAPALAQDYPTKPVRMIVPFPAAGPLDMVARLVSAKLASRLGQPFLVENRAGAGGNIGMEAVMNAAPDGHTVLWALDSMLTVNPVIYKELPDPLVRLKPVSLLAESVATLVIHPGLNVGDTDDFVKLSHQQRISYASAGMGSPGHRTMEYYKLLSGARLTHVPYKGNAPAVQSLLAGETQAFITPIAGVLSHVRAGKLKAIAVTSGKRSPVLPDVPTLVELGYPKFNVVAWYSVFVPAKTPQRIADRLEREIGAIAKLPDVREGMAKFSLDPVWDSGKAVIARAKDERALWAEVIQKTGMKVE
jgi:tripartite-type tricarboxylate transporter receptor subunit TctC